jgi:chromosomal replication initiation ATPase DnaA
MNKEVIMRMAVSAIEAGGLDSKSRQGPKKHCRAYLMRHLYNNTDLTFKEIGNMFGGRDHSTVRAAIQVANKKLAEEDIIFYNDIAFLNLYIKTVEMRLVNLEKTLKEQLKRVQKTGSEVKIKKITKHLDEVKKKNESKS